MKSKSVVFSIFKKIRTKYKYAGIAFFAVFSSIAMASPSFAEAPSLFFSDMTDGPVTGWEGSAAKGAAVSVWGLNVGSTRGTSTVKVCGVTLNNDSDYAEWGATTTPTTARGLQRITFYLNSSMLIGDGTISVTTPSGTSTTIPFHCRAQGSNKIYFVARTGSDSNNGLSTSTPWLTASKVRGTLTAGDVAYFRTGVWNEDDGNNTVIYWNDINGSSRNHNNGTVNKSITLASYPGEVAQLGDSSRGFVIRHSWHDVLNYWTLSKFTMRSNQELTYWMGGNQPMSDDNFRVIGNDLSTTYGVGLGSILTFSGGANGETNLYVLGNWIHDAGSDTRGQIPVHRAYGIYLQGEGFHDNVEIAWNEIAYQARGRGIQLYGHTTTDSADNIKIHDNFIHHNSMTGAILSGGDGGTGTDGTSGRNYVFTKNVYFYNNIVSSNGDNTAAEGAGSIYNAVLIGGVGWGGNAGNFYLYNNTFYNNKEGELDIYTMGTPPTAVVLKNNIVYGTRYVLRDVCSSAICGASTNNLYYGASGNGPSWDNNRLDNTNPLFTSSAPLSYVDFQLQPTSPAKDSGISTLSLVTKDFKGTARPKNFIFDIGAFELSSAVVDTTIPSAPVIKSLN